MMKQPGCRFDCLHTSVLVLLVAISFISADIIDFFQPTPIHQGLETNVWGAAGVIPRDADNGIEDPDWCYWDGNIIKGSDGKYHMYPSRWAESNGHTGYRSSQVVHAVSDSPTGPFISQGNAYTWNSGLGHNPEVVRLPDGRLALHLSDRQPGDVLIADNEWGPWVHQGAIQINNNGFIVNEGLLRFNLSAVVRPDGNILMITRLGHIMLSTNGIMGPYYIQTGSIYPYHLYSYTPDWEDPCLWRSGGKYHVMVNDWSRREAIHLTSDDGINNWQFQGLAYNPFEITRYTDGTISQWNKIERAKPYIDESGHVTHFSLAVVDVPKENELGNDNHSSKVIVVPFNGAAFDSGSAKLTGSAFGTSPAWNNGTNTYGKASDGTRMTFFDYANPNGGYTGIDLGAGRAAVISKIRFFPRANNQSRMAGGQFQGSNTSSSAGFVTLHTISGTPTLAWNEVSVSNPTSWRYLRYLGPANSYCNIAELEFFSSGTVPPPPPPQYVLMNGTAFGTSPAAGGGSSTFNKASDGNVSTFFDYANANGGYTGIDLGSGIAKPVTKIRYHPRSGFESRMNGGRFQGSNTSSTSGFVTLFTIPPTPTPGWTEVAVTNPTAWRYLRYLSPNGSYGNIAEMEYYTAPFPTTELSGSAFGTSPAWGGGSNTYDKASDGNTSTFFDYANANGGYTGIDLGSGNAKVVSGIRFYPRNANAARMVGGQFQGSNTSSSAGFVTLHSVAATPPSGWTEVLISNPGAWRYLRYLGANGSYCNIAEMDFYTPGAP